MYRIRTFPKYRRNCCNTTHALYILKPVSPVPFATTEPDVRWVVSRRTVKRRLRDRRIARFRTGLSCLYSVASKERENRWETTDVKERRRHVYYSVPPEGSKRSTRRGIDSWTMRFIFIIDRSSNLWFYEWIGRLLNGVPSILVREWEKRIEFAKRAGSLSYQNPLAKKKYLNVAIGRQSLKRIYYRPRFFRSRRYLHRKISILFRNAWSTSSRSTLSWNSIEYRYLVLPWLVSVNLLVARFRMSISNLWIVTPYLRTVFTSNLVIILVVEM